MTLEELKRRDDERYARFKEEMDRLNAVATEAVLTAARIARYGSAERR